MPLAHPAAVIVARSAELARAFRKRGMPVVLVHVTAAAPGRTDAGPRMTSFPVGWDQLVPELEQQPDDFVVSKQRVGAFIGTALDAYLRERAVTQVFLTGIATSGGVEATARSAQDHGYNVVLVTDAMTDRDLESHDLHVNRMFPRIGETTSTADLLRVMEEQAG